jgi:hypothetical protein
VNELLRTSRTISDAVDAGRLAIVGCQYRLTEARRALHGGRPGRAGARPDRLISVRTRPPSPSRGPLPRSVPLRQARGDAPPVKEAEAQ